MEALVEESSPWAEAFEDAFGTADDSLDTVVVLLGTTVVVEFAADELLEDEVVAFVAVLPAF